MASPAMRAEPTARPARRPPPSHGERGDGAASSSGSSGSSSSNPDDSGVIAGAVIGVILFLGTIICVSVAILVKQGKMRNPLERLKVKLGKRQVHVAEMTPAK